MAAPVLALLVADLTQRSVLEGELRREGFAVSSHSAGGSLRAATRRVLPDAFLLDGGLLEARDPTLAGWIGRSHPRTARILLTRGGPEFDPADGPWDGPFTSIAPLAPGPGLPAAIRRSVESARLARRVRCLEREVAGRPWEGLIGRSSALRALVDELDRLAAAEVTVLLHGEPGTGKTHVARALHAVSGRRGGTLVLEDCTRPRHVHGPGRNPLPEGSPPPGSVHLWSALFEEARGGTLFLRQADRLEPAGQEALLRALREWDVDAADGSPGIPWDFRLVVASREPLRDAVGRGAFRQDLFEGLRGVEVGLPTLRHRVGDIPDLVEHFARVEAPGRLPPRLAAEAVDRLFAYPWPGNVGELRHAVRRALATCEEEIGLADLPPSVRLGAPPSTGVASTADGPGPLPPDTLELQAVERWAIERALMVCRGNLTEAAARLGIGRTTLYRKLEVYGLR